MAVAVVLVQEAMLVEQEATLRSVRLLRMALLRHPVLIWAVLVGLRAAAIPSTSLADTDLMLPALL